MSQQLAESNELGSFPQMGRSSHLIKSGQDLRVLPFPEEARSMLVKCQQACSIHRTAATVVMSFVHDATHITMSFSCQLLRHQQTNY